MNGREGRVCHGPTSRNVQGTANTKHQVNFKHQAPIPQFGPKQMERFATLRLTTEQLTHSLPLLFGVWRLFGVWCLVFPTTALPNDGGPMGGALILWLIPPRCTPFVTLRE